MVIVTEFRYFAHQDDENHAGSIEFKVPEPTLFANRYKIPSISNTHSDFLRAIDYDEIAQWYEDGKIKVHGSDKEHLEEFLKARVPYPRIEVFFYEWDF